MKCSISMSCLDASTGKGMSRTPENSKKWNHQSRLCYSLSSRKSRRNHGRRMYWSVWGSMEEISQEELWKSCLQVMKGKYELNQMEAEAVREFLEDYSKISDWLNFVQVERSKFSNSILLSHLADDMCRNQQVQREMNERGRFLATNLPRLKEEFEWRMKHMNSQWDSLLKILNCGNSTTSNEFGTNNQNGVEKLDIEWVSRWLREMENELQPLVFNLRWTSANIHTELVRHQNLQTEIEEKSPQVHAVFRLCRNRSVSKKRADILEGRWIQLRLRILEWIEHLSRIQLEEAAFGKKVSQGKENSTGRWELSEDEVNEPLTKVRRLGSWAKLDQSDEEQQTNSDDYWRSMGQGHEGNAGNVYHQPSSSTVSSSVIELSFDGVISGNESATTTRLKRKVPSIHKTQPISSFLLHSPTKPTNISTYYFKHSDTEGEGGQTGITPIQNKESENEKPRHVITASTRQTLESSQHFQINSNSSTSQPILDLVGEMEDMDCETFEQNLGEIEDLVQKAELLVQESSGKRRQFSMSQLLESWGLGGVRSGSWGDYSSLFLPKTLGNYKEEMCSCRKALEEVGAVGGQCHCSIGTPKVPKKHSRVRQWIRATTTASTSILSEQKTTSSCDASGESASETDSSDCISSCNGTGEEPQVSSDDPTTLTASTTLLFQQQQQYLTTNSSPKRGSSYGSLKSDPTEDVTLRPKKLSATTAKQQRPKSFTDNILLGNRNTGFEKLPFEKTLSPIHDKASVFVSDSALNFLYEKGSGSDEGSTPDYNGCLGFRERRRGKLRRRLLKQKTRYNLDIENDQSEHCTSKSTFGGFAEMEHQLVDIENTLPPSAMLKPVFKFGEYDNAPSSLNTEGVLTNTEQDWDSYQEKYLSEPYSEEPYDQDRTLKLLAFGEDYYQVLDKKDSESSSLHSEFHEMNTSRRRPLNFDRNDVAESDSDREEFNHFLNQCQGQLKLIDAIFRKRLQSYSSHPHRVSESSSEYAEMEATCEENINSLKLVLSNVEKTERVAFVVDIPSIKGVLENWNLLRDRIIEASKLSQIQHDLKFLRQNFESIQMDLGQVDPFDSKDLDSLKSKIDRIQTVVDELSSKRGILQSVNEASVGTQIYLKEVNGEVKKQLKTLYALYEENFQLGTYLLEKMRILEDAWSSFEQERDAFERSMALIGNGNNRGKLKKSLISSGASTDSGHGTDFSHSDSDMDEKRQKLVALRNRAYALKSFLPPGSPVLDVIDCKIHEAEKDFEMMEKVEAAPLNLKLILPKRKSPIRKPGMRGMKSQFRGPIAISLPRNSSQSTTCRKEASRHWRTLRFSISFHIALMGLFAVAWFLQPRCCENLNTFSFSLVPHLTHDRIPHM